MALTNLQVKQATAQDKPYMLADGKGMYLFVATLAMRSTLPIFSELKKSPRLNHKKIALNH
jgi:hypothetical protein